MKFHEFRHWSITLGEKAVRLSVFDERGQEHFEIIPDRGGREYREARDAALNRIADRMEAVAA